MAYDVFISYGSPDRNLAESLCAFLEMQGLSCWIAPRNIPSGSNYAGEITRALRLSDTIIVICSMKSSQSQHVKNEVTLAFNQNKRILPYCLEENCFDDDLEYFLSSRQQIRYSGNTQEDFEQILHILGKNMVENAPPQKQHKKGRGRKAGIILFTLLSMCFIALKWFSRNKETVSEVVPVTSIELMTDSFTGSIIDGHPDGFGTYTFAKQRQIDLHDPENRIAETGDYIHGNWENGHLNYGEWYDVKGTSKGFIQIGNYPDIELDWQLGICEKL